MATILIIDDNDAVRTALEVLLSLQGHHPLTANGPDEGLRILAREPVAWGPTREALGPANLLRARAMSEAFDERGDVCRRSAA